MVYVWPSDDWAREFSPSALEQYQRKIPRVPCTSLVARTRRGEDRTVYYILRDAGLFLDRECSAQIEQVRSEITQGSAGTLGLRFYELQLGKTAALSDILREFDANAISTVTGRKASSESLAVELFGFVSEWEETMPRMREHLAHAEGEVAQRSRTARDWKRYLFGAGTPYETACHAAADRLGLSEVERGKTCGPPVYPGHGAVLRLGANRDVSALARLRQKVQLMEPSERFILYVSSRLAEPGKFSDEFVESYPPRAQDWPMLESSEVDPYFHARQTDYEFYVPGELAAIAKTGHPQAIQKLLQSSLEASGAPAEIFYGGVIDCLITVPAATLAQLGGLRPSDRSGMLRDAFILDLGEDAAAQLLDAIAPSRPTAPALTSEIEQLVRETREAR